MSTSAIPIESLQLIYAVQHPCHVVNCDRAIETLGGRQRLVDVFTHSTTSQLTCSFTPSNIYERPLRAERQKTTGLLLRLRRNKHTKTVKSIHVIGILDTSYSFESLADFQYLPMIKKNDQYESFLNRVALNRQCLDKENLERPCPLMCIPAIFSRFFDPTDYAFRPEPKARPKRTATTITRAKQAMNSNKLTKRNVRSSAAHHIGFDATTVPTGPKSSNDLYTNVDQSIITHLRRLFDQRPVWTRNSLLYHLKITEVILKRIIHHVAYFFCNGPWNRCWVKYGYDPRSDTKSKIYQIVDYRVRAILDPEKNLVKSRTSRAYHRSSLIPGQMSSTATTISASNTKNYAEEMYMFKRTSLPVARSIHYQLIDIQLEEVQQMVHSNDGQEHDCTENDGWCVVDYQNRAREMMSAAHEQLYRQYQREREHNVTGDDDDASQQLEEDEEHDEEEEEEGDEDDDDHDEESNEEEDDEDDEHEDSRDET
ncbi:unnamed protein product [Adineta steineri]|uniref:Uncharacterized protein n=1 Tax=Adineta steineri TaxID=433720 RepID=A0A813YVN6_9BILA|nr:unnamed protein product [Adineta steineri]CAF0878393.1 unnamed protein product [Adineta steineri]CAF0889372.1 unnamed protein product [Adineta steineri]CAF1324426.1 unnamed protein product [Adineta steineri]CAF1586247.1 unnamed protein product [Adineta steineri]